MKKNNFKNIFFLMEKYSDLIMQEDFSNHGYNSYDNTFIYFRQWCFLGLNGFLSYEDSFLLQYYPNIIKFLSIFSSRLLMLRKTYTYKLLPNGYGKDFLDIISGFNLLNISMNKNKNLNNLLLSLKENLNISILIKKFFFKKYKHKILSSRRLSKIILGKKFFFIVFQVIFFCSDYSFCKNLFLNKNIFFIISSYSNSYEWKILLKFQKILIKNYFLSRKIFFTYKIPLNSYIL